jgi:hypothetical protein
LSDGLAGAVGVLAVNVLADATSGDAPDRDRITTDPIPPPTTITTMPAASLHQIGARRPTGLEVVRTSWWADSVGIVGGVAGVGTTIVCSLSRNSIFVRHCGLGQMTVPLGSELTRRRLPQ